MFDRWYGKYVPNHIEGLYQNSYTYTSDYSFFVMELNNPIKKEKMDNCVFINPRIINKIFEL